MGQAIPRQHPAVVLRSHFNQLRALLVVALIALAGLTVAVVILANDSDDVGGTSAVAPAGSIRYGEFNPATGQPEAAPLPQVEHPLQSRAGDARLDGGPEEGAADVSPSQPRVTQDSTFPGLASEANAAQADGVRSDGGPEEGTRGIVPPLPSSAQDSGVKDYSLNGATGDYAHGPLPPDAPAKDYSKNAATGD